MSYKIKISDLTPAQLNAACLVKISKFAIALKAYDGTVLDLRSDEIVKEVVRAVKNTDDPELHNIYRSIKQEISKHINSPRFTKHIANFDQVYAGSRSSQNDNWAKLGT